MNKKITKHIVLSTILIALSIYIISGFYNPLVLTEYKYSNSKIPEAFNGYKIIQLTDFHCKEFGNKEDKLIQLIASCNPDLIALTGDFADEIHSLENIEYLFEGICNLAPVYFVAGNHEYYDSTPYDEFVSLLNKYNITYLKNTTEEITLNNSSILISGLEFKGYMYGLRDKVGYADTNFFNILLFHGTDRFDDIADYNYDLILSGHIHGGIIRLPIIGGLIDNDKTLFPKYDYGIYTSGISTMISSSGLGDASLPRFHNPREVVCITLSNE